MSTLTWILTLDSKDNVDHLRMNFVGSRWRRVDVSRACCHRGLACPGLNALARFLFIDRRAGFSVHSDEFPNPGGITIRGIY
jgi:hypothetical protein